MNGGQGESNVVMSRWDGRRLAMLVGLLVLAGLTINSRAIAQPAKNRNSLKPIQDRHRDRFNEYANAIKKLADDCVDKNLPDAAEEVRSRVFVPDSESLRVNQLPSDVLPEISGSADSWEKRLRLLETNYAKDLYLQSRSALKQGYPSYAYNLVREAALHDPDQPQARKILGFVRHKNEWVTPFAQRQLNEQKVWNENFGWLPKAHLQRYIDGERYIRPRWVSAEQEKELRREFKSAWEVRTDHYLIKTNVSLEKGVELGKALEDFYRVFNETFAGFFLTPEQLQKLFEGSSNTVQSAAQPFTIHFYRTRDEYLERMRKFFPGIDQTNGVYLTSDKVVHFYLDLQRDNLGTLFHEATHQLFYESQSKPRTICANHHFWIIEGIACYMESFQRKNGAVSLGDLNHIRFVGARNNLLQQSYYVPLQELSSFGMQDFQHQPEKELVKNYTQAAGLARFFMHYDNGRYREALVKHLADLYSVNDRIRENAEGLDVLTGVPYSELDRQYAEDARESDTK